jgi:hypothetical protein
MSKNTASLTEPIWDSRNSDEPEMLQRNGEGIPPNPYNNSWRKLEVIPIRREGESVECQYQRAVAVKKLILSKISLYDFPGATEIIITVR